MPLGGMHPLIPTSGSATDGPSLSFNSLNATWHHDCTDVNRDWLQLVDRWHKPAACVDWTSCDQRRPSADNCTALSACADPTVSACDQHPTSPCNWQYTVDSIRGSRRPPNKWFLSWAHQSPHPKRHLNRLRRLVGLITVSNTETQIALHLVLHCESKKNKTPNSCP